MPARRGQYFAAPTAFRRAPDLSDESSNSTGRRTCPECVSRDKHCLAGLDDAQAVSSRSLSEPVHVLEHDVIKHALEAAKYRMRSVTENVKRFDAMRN